MQDLHPLFAARHFIETHSHLSYDPLQWGSQLKFATQDNLDLGDADIVIIGCGERRGNNRSALYSQAPDAIRKQLYQLYNWHPSVKVVDAGNILQGASVDDSRAALRMVLQELQEMGKIVILLGGSHDLSLQQYEAFKAGKQVVSAVAADMFIDLDEAEELTDRSFLMDMLTAEPNYVRHYTHLGFQSYYVQPRMLEMLDKLRFDFHRVGRLKEHMEDAEPALRSADIFAFDLSTVRYSDAPANVNGSPNGFSGEEACMLTRYAGMSSQLTSFGIFGYDPEKDIHEMTARLIAQMIWYFIDGIAIRNAEASLSERDEFAEFHVSFTSNDTTFLKSKRTSRWWIQLPDSSFVPCSYSDYLQACNDEIPERWLREQERLM
jgi:formiminoglutamase